MPGSTSKKPQRPIDRVHHVESDMPPVDGAIDRRFPHRALRDRIVRATKRLEATLGSQRVLWLKLEEPLNELRTTREDEYFDMGFEHGFAAGRVDAKKGAAAARQLAARLRDLAIQGVVSHEDALAALLEAALALAVEAAPARRTRQTR